MTIRSSLIWALGAVASTFLLSSSFAIAGETESTIAHVAGCTTSGTPRTKLKSLKVTIPPMRTLRVNMAELIPGAARNAMAGTTWARMVLIAKASTLQESSASQVRQAESSCHSSSASCRTAQLHRQAAFRLTSKPLRSLCRPDRSIWANILMPKVSRSAMARRAKPTSILFVLVAMEWTEEDQGCAARGSRRQCARNDAQSSEWAPRPGDASTSGA